MENKKKYHYFELVILSVLFVFLLGQSVFAGYNDPYSQEEVDQINEFFNLNFTVQDYNNFLNVPRNYHSNLNLDYNKLNICYAKDNTYLYLMVTNGTFSSTLPYIKIKTWSNTYLNFRNDGGTIYGAKINLSNKSIGDLQFGSENVNTGLNPPFTVSGNYFTSSHFLTSLPTYVIYASIDNGTTYNSYFSTNYIILDGFLPDEPDESSGETGGLGYITNPSGENGGSINLEPIQQGLNNIQNQISGDTQKVIENQNQNTQTIVNAISGDTEKITNTLTDSADDLIDNTIITSGDIESALNFEIAQDPYSNFWITLTNNLKNALLGVKRSIDISFQGRIWTISLDEYMVLPAWLVIILTPFSTAFFTWVLVRQFKLIFDKIASGNIDSLLKENSEERYF